MPINNVPAVNVTSVTPTSPFTSCTNGVVPLTANTAATVRPALSTRKYLAVINTGSSDVTLILGPTTGATVGTGIILKGGGGSSYETSEAIGLYTGAISAIAASSATLAWTECTP